MKFVKRIVLGALVIAPMFGFAEDGESASGVTWEKNVSMGASFKEGNTEQSLYTLDLKVNRLSAEFDLLSSLYAEYGRTGTSTSDKERTEGQVRGQSEYRRTIKDSKFFAGVFGEIVNDSITKVWFRGKMGPNIGYYLMDTDNMKLDASFGINYVYERTATSEGDFGEYRAALNYLWDFTETASYYLNVEYSANVEKVNTDNNGFLVTGVRTKINETLSFFGELREEYDNLPDAGIKHTDLTVIAGLSYDF
ncbi:MAG: DUF481 domain-containing protein [Pontiella sp.]